MTIQIFNNFHLKSLVQCNHNFTNFIVHIFLNFFYIFVFVAPLKTHKNFFQCACGLIKISIQTFANVFNESFA